MTHSAQKDHPADDGQATAIDVAPGATEAAGRAFAAMFRALKLVRPVRPIHPEGLGLVGELHRTGSSDGPRGSGSSGGSGRQSGIDWLDTAGTDSVQARFSRSVGLPQQLPDILGLALRVTPDGGGPGSAPYGGVGSPASVGVGGPSTGAGPADILFASTGWQVPGRFLLAPRLDVAGAALTTLMPYRGRKGPVLLGLRTTDLPAGSLASGDWVLELCWARPTGPWHPFGELRLRAQPEPADTPLRFNPLANQPPGAQAYTWARRLRERSYRAAQRPAPPAVVHSNPASQPAGGLSAAGAGASERKPMATVSQVFNSPASDVWRVIADGWLYSGWVVGASRIRAVDDTWPAAGARLHHSVGAWPLVIDDSTQVTAVEPGRRLELVARGWPMGEAKVVITVEDRGNECLVTMVEDAIRGPGKKVPKVLRDPAISVRNRETLKRLELMAAGGAGK